MTTLNNLSTDSQAVALLCSSFGLSGKASSEMLRPLSLKEWNELARKIHASNIKRPGGMFGLTVNDLKQELNIEPLEAERIGGLLDRGGHFAIEIEKWTNKGIWMMTRVDSQYPEHLRKSLKQYAPAVLFGAGDMSLLNRKGMAVIGSRNVDESGKAFAQRVAYQCAQQNIIVISGGARGTDAIAMEASIESGGTAIGVLADSLEKNIRTPEIRALLMDGKLTLITPYSPSSGFSVGAAMGRNKIVYGLADYAVVVASDYERGGTWAGATESLKHGFCSVFVRIGDNSSIGNNELVKKGAIPLSDSQTIETENLFDWIKNNSEGKELSTDIKIASQSYHQPSLITEPLNKATPPNNNGSGKPESYDLYQIFLSYVKDLLKNPCTSEEIQEIFGIEKSQLNAWLKRAMADNQIIRKGRPVRYKSVA